MRGWTLLDQLLKHTLIKVDEVIGEAECLSLVSVVGLMRPQVPVESPLPTSIQRGNFAVLIKSSIPVFEHSHGLLELCLLFRRQRAKLKSDQLKHFRQVFQSKDVGQVVHNLVKILDGELNSTGDFFLKHLVNSNLTRMAINRCAIVVDSVIASLPAIR